MPKKIKVTLVHGCAKLNKRQKLTVRGLGLRRIGGSVVLADTAPARGMIQRVIHLLDVEKEN